MIRNVIPFVHEILENTVTKDDITIDCTCGNGFDTLKLAELSKFVYAFDIQNIAIDNTIKLLIDKNLDNYKVIKDSHCNIDKYIKQSVKAITFNLGYLPGGDKSVTTAISSTLSAIEKSIDLLAKGGSVFITLYIGHEGGLGEALEVESFAKTLDRRRYKVAKYDFINKVHSPFVIIIEKQS